MDNEIIQNEETSESESEYQESENFNVDDNVMDNGNNIEDENGEENEGIVEVDEQTLSLRRTTRVNAGKGVDRIHPFVQFTMKEKKVWEREC